MAPGAHKTPLDAHLPGSLGDRHASRHVQDDAHPLRHAIEGRWRAHQAFQCGFLRGV
jgi:hypothetical protein